MIATLGHRRIKLAESRGFTLIEILVVVVLLGMTSLLIAYAFQDGLIRNEASMRRLEDQSRLVRALQTFSEDVQQARAILRLLPEQIVIWRADLDNDGQPDAQEVIEYRWQHRENVPAPWRRVAHDVDNELILLEALEVGGDSLPPGTRHVVIHAASGTATDSHWLGTSVSLRGSARDF